MRDNKRLHSGVTTLGWGLFSVKMLFYKIKQNKRILADLNRRVEFVVKLLFMESLLTGWKMLWENGGKRFSLFHDFSIHYPCGYQ